MPCRPKQILPTMLLAVILLFTACRTTSPGYRDVVPRADNRSAEERLASVTGSYSQWQTFTAKGRFTVSGRESLSASMQMRMAHDRYIYISLRGGMGIEGGKIFITRDSLYVIDKINKCYVADEISLFTAGIPVTLGELQQLLLCRAFNAGSTPAMAMAAGNGGFAATTVADDSLATFTFAFDRYNLLGTVSASTSTGLASCNVGYSGYIDTDKGGIVATSIAIISQMQDTQLALQADYSPASIKWDSPLDDRLSIPPSYNRADAQSLLTQLGNEL